MFDPVRSERARSRPLLTDVIEGYLAEIVFRSRRRAISDSSTSRPPGTGDDGYAEAFDRLVEPVIEQYAPDLLIASAGGDAGTVDPLGRNVVTKSGFGSLGARTRDIAANSASGRLVLLQEGGYHPSHLAYAMLGTLEGILGIDSEIDDPFAWLDEDFESAADRLAEIRECYADWWSLE